MKPPIVYYGAKGGVADRIVALLPRHRHYVEPFCGSLAVLLAKPPAPMETVNDLDRDLMTFWRVLRDQPDTFQRVCALTPHSRAEYTACADIVGDDVEVARRVWVRLTQGRGAQLRRPTGWRHFKDPLGAGAAGSMPGYLEAYRRRIPPAAARLINVSLECRPALELIQSYGDHADTLLYIDPPYLGSTRMPGNQYRHELRSEGEHRQLAEALSACRASVVVSGYPSPLYDRELYAGWDRVELPTQNSQGGTGSPRTEVLWSNRPLRAHEHLFAGLNAEGTA